MDIETISPFREICRKICLNIPETCTWRWDHQRELALITLDKQDADLVFFPLFKEFKDQWSFSPATQAESLIARLLNSEYGLMPGQTFFTSRPINDLVLFVAWWPWGKNDKISMRIGFFPLQPNALPSGFSFSCLNRWLRINA
jgi:hypothetical protein